MAAAQDGILEELRRLRARVPQLTGALAADVDGSSWPRTPRVSIRRPWPRSPGPPWALAARLADATGQGDLRELLLRGRVRLRRHVRGGRRGRRLTLLAQDRVNVGRLHLEGRRAGCPDRGARRQRGRRAHTKPSEGAREARSGTSPSGVHAPGPKPPDRAPRPHRTDGGRTTTES